MELLEGAATVERALLNQASRKKIPINGSIELLPLCNMNCDMCYVRLSREEMESKGRMRTAKEWLEIARQMQKSGVLFLLLTGGEPLLFPDFKELYLELQKLGMILTVNTNGTLIDEEWACFFGKNKPRRINITLYGANKESYAKLCHYSEGFEKTINAVRLLRNQGVDVKISGSLTKVNEEDIEGIVSMGDDLGVPTRIDTYMMPAVRERSKPYDLQSRLDPLKAANVRVRALKSEMKDAFIEFAKAKINEVDNFTVSEERKGKMSCLAGKSSFTINWQGEMRPCVVLSKPAISVFEVGFETAWRYILEKTDEIVLNAKCDECKLRPLCRVCAASALLETGDYLGIPDYMCQYAKETLRLLHLEVEGCK